MAPINADNKQETHFLSTRKVFIAGGGIAGLTFASALLRKWTQHHKTASQPLPEIHIYERDHPDPALQREGYSLSLTSKAANGGLMVMQDLGLLDQVMDVSLGGRDDSSREIANGCFKIWGPDWTERAVFRHRPDDRLHSSSIRITRKELRQILLDSCGESVTIHWEQQCLDVAESADGRLVVDMASSSGHSRAQETCDLLIAADGASSKLRQRMFPSQKLVYTGSVLRGGLSKFAGPLPKPIHQDWGFHMSGTGMSCFYSPIDESTILWAMGHREDAMGKPLDLRDGNAVDAVLNVTEELGKHFSKPFLEVLRRTDRSTVMCINANDKLPFCHDALRSGGMPVIFIGDANHAMSPFAGVGANLAIRDGYDLAAQLVETGTLEHAVERYDQVSEPRARKAITEARSRLYKGYSNDTEKK